MESVSGKVVCITGASAGIGAATARLFAKYNARLALLGRNAERLEQVAQECRELGLKEEDVLTVIGDISKDDDVRRIADDVIRHFKTVHCLVNNAGVVCNPSNLPDVPLGDVDHLMALFVKGPLLLCQLFTNEIQKNKGSIVNVGSISSLVPYPPALAYSTAKAAQDHMTKCMALDFVKKGVRVNSICPGPVLTDIAYWSGLVPTSEDARKMFTDFGQKVPIGRAAQPEEIAYPIVFLASESASYITGQLLVVDGGMGLTTSK